jgi:hypothetical protein
VFVVNTASGGILLEPIAMRAIKVVLASLCVGASLALAGCGGGSVDVGVEVGVDVPVTATAPVAAFDIIMFVNGQQVAGVDLLPSEEQDVYVPVGNSFELEASGPVAWTVVVGGRIVSAPVGSRIDFGGASVMQTLITNARFAASTGSVGFLPNPVVVTLVATSLVDSQQEAQMNIVLTN